MDRARLIESLSGFRAELQDAEHRAQLALAEVHALRKIVDGVEGLIEGGPPQLSIRDSGALIGTTEPNGNYAVVGDPPRGQEAVRRILVDSRREWKRGALIDEVIRRGWVNPAAKHKKAAVGTALDRLVSSKEVERSAPATYRYPPDKLPPVQDDGGEVRLTLTPGGGDD